jgi:hypothetical protein
LSHPRGVVAIRALPPQHTRDAVAIADLLAAAPARPRCGWSLRAGGTALVPNRFGSTPFPCVWRHHRPRKREQTMHLHCLLFSVARPRAGITVSAKCKRHREPRSFAIPAWRNPFGTGPP